MQHLELFFTADLVPKKNSFRAGITRNGRLYQFKGNRARASQEDLHNEAWIQCRRLGWVPIERPKGKNKGLGLHAEFVFKKTRADLIGVTETVQDALQSVAYEDDKQITSQSMRWDDQDNPFLPEGCTAYARISTRE